MSSHATDAAIGMMDGAYFTSRNEILSFLNTLLDLNLAKIEQTASGAVACQVIEYIFPNSIAMSKVNWAAKGSHEYVTNYKLLQGAFSKNNIQKYIDVDKMIRGKYQDNLEFCQWLKAFFDQTSSMMNTREGYDPIAVRAKGKGGKAVPSGNRVNGMKKVGSAASSSSSAPRAVASGAVKRAAPLVARSVASSVSSSKDVPPRPTSGGSSVSSITRISAASGSLKENASNSRVPTAANTRKPPSSSNAYEEEIRALKSENAALESKYAKLQRSSAVVEMSLQTVESERDFYFEKLRGIEVMLQVYKEKEEECTGSGGVNRVMDRMFKVMYATMEDDVIVDDEGNLVGDVTLETSVNKCALSLKAKEDDYQDAFEEHEEPSRFDDGATDDFANMPMATPMDDADDCASEYNADDMDDEDLLVTSEFNYEAVIQQQETEDAPKTVGGEINNQSTEFRDDASFSDEDLLTD